MRKTIASLETQIENLKKVSEPVRVERDSLEKMLRFYQTHESLITTGTIALEKMTDVLAHVITDMKSLRDNPKERR